MKTTSQRDVMTSASIRSKYPMVWFPCHGNVYGDDGAETAVDRMNQYSNMQAAPVIAAGELTFGGTPAAIWNTKVGVFSAVAGDVFATDTSEAFRAFCDLSTATDGGILILMKKNEVSGAPTTAEYILGYSVLHGTGGGWELWQNATAGQLYCSITEPDGGSTVHVARDTNNPTANTDYAYLVYIDVNNDTAVIYRDTTQQTTINDLPELPMGNVAHGFALFARSDSGNTNPLGANGSDTDISDIQIYRVNEDISGDLSTIAAQYTSNPQHIPRILQAIV